MSEKEIVVDIRSTEEYKYLLEQAHACLVETTFSAQVELLKGKWTLGKLIVEESSLYKDKDYGSKVVDMLADDIEISRSHMFKIIQFYKKFPLESFDEVMSKLPGGKALSWYNVCQTVLPEVKPEEEKIVKECDHDAVEVKCMICKKKLPPEDYEIAVKKS